MSGKQYYRDLLLRVQDKIRGLGATNKNRWAAFCYGGSMSLPEFTDKVKKYNVQFNDGDMDIIWDSVGISGDMKFTDFLKFMQTDVDDFNPVTSQRGRSAPPQSSGMSQARDAYETPSYGGGNNYNQPSYGGDRFGGDRFGGDRFGNDNYGGDRFGNDNFDGDRFGGNDRFGQAPPPSLGGNADDLIHENLRDIVISCMSKDSLMTGEVSRNAFLDICSKLGITESLPGFSKILQAGDPSYSGLIQYFTIASKICSDSALPSTGGSGYGAGSGSSYGGYGAPASKPSYGYDAPAPKPSYGGGFDEPRSSYRDKGDNISLRDTAPKRDAFNDNPAPRKSAYQSSISFGDDGGAPQPRQRKAAMEESNIWGDPAPRQASPQRASLPIGGGYGASYSAASGDADEVLAKISTKVSEGIGNSSAAFNKWRGYNTRLVPEDLLKGLQRDCDYSPPLEVVREICSRYGGELSLTGFVKMMGDGTTMGQKSAQARPKSSFTPSTRKMTEDDQTIEDIAAQFNGRDFELIAGRARNAEELCNIFRRNNIQFDESRVKKLIAKQGKNGFCDSILVRLGQ